MEMVEIPEMPEAFRIEQASLTANCKHQNASIGLVIKEDGSIDLEKLQEDWQELRVGFWKGYAERVIQTSEEYQAIIKG